jgi:hypothetical protein
LHLSSALSGQLANIYFALCFVYTASLVHFDLRPQKPAIHFQGVDSHLFSLNLSLPDLDHVLMSRKRNDALVLAVQICCEFTLGLHLGRMRTGSAVYGLAGTSSWVLSIFDERGGLATGFNF